MSRLVGKSTIWFQIRSDTNQAAQSQRQAKSLKFLIKEEMYYPCSENKGADREADLRLCFHLGRLLVFPCGGSIVINALFLGKQRHITSTSTCYMNRFMRKPDLCLCENKGAEQLCSNCTADQRLCFRYKGSTITLLPKSEISSF